MTLCNSCFVPTDQRTDTTCDTCHSPLHKECAIKDGGVFCDVCYTVSQETPKKIEFQIPDVIRRTYIETYRTCPFKFLKEVIEGHEQPPTCYTQIGIDLHDLFEATLNDRSGTIEQMKEAFRIIWEGYPDELFTHTTREKMWERSQNSIDTFYHLLPSIPIPMVTEQKITFSIGENMPDVSITMDAILDVDGELEMLDWKTGAVMVGQKLSSDLQAPLYIYAVQKHFQRPVRKFTFYYVNENKERVFERVNDDEYVCRVGKREYKIYLQQAIKDVKRLFTQIVKGNFNVPQDTRKLYFACKMCHIKEQGLCRGAEEEVWHQK